MRFHLNLLSRFFTTFTLIVAFAASGFAHSTIQTEMTPELAAYVANGGSLAELCGTSGRPDQRALAKCEACRLINAAILPTADLGVLDCSTVKTRNYLFIAQCAHNACPLDPARLTRAPPQA